MRENAYLQYSVETFVSRSMSSKRDYWSYSKRVCTREMKRNVRLDLFTKVAVLTNSCWFCILFNTRQFFTFFEGLNFGSLRIRQTYHSRSLVKLLME